MTVIITIIVLILIIITIIKATPVMYGSSDPHWFTILKEYCK